ncbi:MAG: hypothetical protein ACOCYU_00325 [Brevefilum sp.]
MLRQVVGFADIPDLQKLQVRVHAHQNLSREAEGAEAEAASPFTIHYSPNP